jgi:hypothetical protein
MSRNNNARKPYCKVCFDAGKPEIEYTSHWLKDRNGKTLCPTLLNTECRYCYKLGHTAKFCDILSKNNLESERRSQTAAKEKPKQKVVQKKPTNIFATLCDSSDSEKEIKVTTIVDYPVLGAPAKKDKPEVKTGWAAIAAKPKEDIFIKQIEVRSLTRLLPQSVIKATNPAPQGHDYTKKIYSKNWADWTDSDDSDEEEEVVPQKTTYIQAVDDDDILFN